MDTQALSTILLAVMIGVSVIIFSARMRIPAIALLLVSGVAAGPFGLGLLQPSVLGEGLRTLTQVAVAVILFHGGLALNPSGFRKAPDLIRRLLSIGMLLGWLLSATAIHFLLGFSWGISFLTSSLVVVTGPTVIMPILQRVRVREDIHQTLLWESVLVDPVGVFLATLCFELVISGAGFQAIGGLAIRLFAGIGIGAFGGLLLAWLLRRNWIPDENVNLSALAVAAGVFGACESIAHESGVLGVLVAGFTLALRKPPNFSDIEKFKSELSELLISILFVLLAANLDLYTLKTFGLPGILSVAVVILVARPMNVWVSSVGLQIDWRARVFISWIAPRGIIAASMASLFALELRDDHPAASNFMEIFTFAVIGVTVIVQGLSASLVARGLGLMQPKPERFAIIGAHAFARGVAQWLDAVGKGPTLLLDTNASNVDIAKKMGLCAIRQDATIPSVFDLSEVQATGSVIALTDNIRLNSVICHLWSENLPEIDTYRWAVQKSSDFEGEGQVIWTGVPAPSVLSAELEAQRIHWGGFEPTGSIGATEKALQPTRLAALSEKGDTRELVFDLAGDADGPTLCLLHQAPELIRFVDTEASGLLAAGDAASKEEALRSLIARVAGAHPTLNEATLLEDVLRREKVFSTAIGGGIAIPHANVYGLPEPILCIGLLEKAIDFNADDGVPVQAMFLLLSPAGQPGRHLQMLSEIARLASHESFLPQLLGAENNSELIRVLGWSHFEN